MNYICPECGSDIPEESEFCYRCGRKRDNTIRVDPAGHFVEPEKNKCTACGAEMSPNDLICQKCGEPRSRIQMATFRPKMVKNGWIGIALAVIGGILVFLPIGPIGPLSGMFSIFGLGHFYFKKWKRGAWFLLITALMFFIMYTEPEMTTLMHFLFFTASVFFFLMQTMEVVMLAFTPPKTTE
ncbi:double zinc ribbon [Candidatus Methanoplasma termitum]|uniref:Double zinc ribbon n=1 Tax=Candidatus Methanoplasma termitum TaxID=1577791 RepID=A0A0A7LFS2_9ARCH|nr:zinc ribbon domain-containing protein [Candidatus Methanoplasma termitum]AIZ56356.1 double zinc ribbon [Candidatus Methanoplasma termitum]MCL2333664.1 zinc ribbon domain-containing protein [Candidatus Methanoplasma sp.]